MRRSHKLSIKTSLICLLALFLIFQAGQTWAQVRIMPLGNSLTSGLVAAGSDPVGGYRDDLATILTNAGINFTFVGSQTHGTGFPADHEGHPGWTVDSLNLFLAGWLTTYQPDIVIAMGGTNDVYEGKSTNVIIGNIKKMWEIIYKYNPNTKIICSSVIPRRDGKNDPTIALNNEILSLYYEKLNLGYKIYYAGIFEMFMSNPNWSSELMHQLDLIHASNAGYTVMAKTYYKSIMNAVNATDPIVTDNFNRTNLSEVWDAPANYVITDNELGISTSDQSWNYLAAYKGIQNPTQLSFDISNSASAADLQFIGVAGMLDKPAKNADGYFVRLTSAGLELWTISNGAVYSEVKKQAAGGATLAPGDNFKVVFSTDGLGHHFECYINNSVIGKITDSKKLKGNSASNYAGLFLRGGHSSRIDNFNLFKSTDKVAPDAIANLEAGIPGAGSVPLTWTATGDDGASGNASRYDIRFSTTVISETSFPQAEQATNSLRPAAPGTTERFTVSGLVSNTKYYFAIKVFDEVGNSSAISNIVSATTSNALGITDEFNRTDLGSDWAVNSEFIIQNGALVNSATDDSWNHVAIFTKRKNPIEVRVVWDETADANGIGQGGFALLMDSPSPNANGYLAWRRNTVQKINLWKIENGALTDQIGAFNAISATPPQPSDEVKVIIRKDESGHHFDFYVNNNFEGTASDPAKQFGATGDTYAGVVLHSNLNNAVESFTVVNTVGAPSDLVYVSGNNQEWAVGKQLPEPIVVKVTDADGMPVSGHKIDFAITAGGGTFDKAVATDGYIRMEGEDAPLSGMYAEQNTECSGGAFITGGNAEHHTAYAEFKFYIQKEADYYMWARVNPRGNASQNSWYWKIDDSQDYVWNSQPKDQPTWGWCTIGAQGNSSLESKPQYEFWTFHLTVGYHTFTLFNREQNAWLDKIIIVDKINYVPQDKEEYPEYRTDGNGEAKALWTLGTQFGENNNKAEARAIGLKGTPVKFVASALGDVPAKMAYISGNNQSGAGGSRLPDTLTVKVMDEHGNPRKNHPVTFTVTAGGGQMVKTQPVLTNSKGIAADFLILGTEDATTRVEASSTYDGKPLTNSPIKFTATATSMIAHEMKYIKGNNQSGLVTETLPNPLVVQIFDDQNNPIPNHTVRFKVTKGTAKLDTNKTEVLIKSNAGGKASVTVTLSTKVDSTFIEASALKLGQHLVGSPIIFKVASKPLEANKLIYHSGNNQTGAVSSPLGKPFVVKVTDQYENPITGHSIIFKVTGGGAKIEGQNSKTVISDGLGLASVILTVGPNEKEMNTCEASGIKGNGDALEGSPIVFQVTPGKVEKVERFSGHNQEGSAGYSLDEPFVAIVKDNYGNPVPNFPLEFKVTKGDGFIGTSRDTVIYTGNDGKASCTYIMGYQPGNENKVEVEGYVFGVPLLGNPVLYKAVAYPATELQYQNGISGPKEFKGTAGLPLPDSVKTRVIDSKGRVLKYFPVTYAIKTGGGKVNEKDRLSVLTNAKGFAAVSWQLGPTPGSKNNTMEATATFKDQPLTHSPRLFTASADKGNPTYMITEGDSQSVVVGSVLENPIKVKITDPAGNPIVGHPVSFKIIQGNGKLNDAFTETPSPLYTDGSGFVQIRWRVGVEKGWKNALVVTSKFSDKHLTNSPDTLWANGLTIAATKLVRVSNERINGSVGIALSQPFQVKITDKFNNGTAGISAKFEIMEGGGKLFTAAGDTDIVVSPVSDPEGNCAATLILGPKVGVDNIVKVTGFNGDLQLEGSPMYFYSKGTPGPVDIDVSQIMSIPPIAAVGEVVNITVRLTDAFGNPPTDKYWVTLSGEGDGLQIVKDPPEQSNESGEAYGQVKSQKSGIKKIYATILGTGGKRRLTHPGTVRFIPLVAHHLGNKLNDNQTGNVSATLPEPIGITVLDQYENPVPNTTVTFKAGDGCDIYEHQPVLSDSNGQAFSHLILGANPGSYTTSVSADGISGSKSFTAQAVYGKAAQIQIHSGNEQIGVAGTEMSDPLMVKVIDSFGRPVYNHIVRFYVKYGKGSFKGKVEERVPSDALGLAAAYYTLDPEIGTNIIYAESPELVASTGQFVAFRADGRVGVAKVLKRQSPEEVQASVLGSVNLTVRTTDNYDNGVADIAVFFKIISGDGTIEQAQPVVSNSDGYAVSKVKVGNKIGPVEVEVSSEGLVNSPLKFAVNVSSANATSMEIAGGNNQQGTVGRQLPFPFEVLVKDQFGNPVKNVSIGWTAIEGSGTISASTLSGEDGIARNYLKLGPNLGSNQVYALNNSLGKPLTFSAEGVTNKFPLIESIEDLVVNEGQPINFTVKASDGDGDPIAYGVQKSTLPQGAKFDSVGNQQFSWTPGYTQAGEYALWFIVKDGKSGIGAEEVKITVKNLNRKPQLRAYYPDKTELSSDRLKGEQIGFTISVQDPDPDDELVYNWFIKNLNLKNPDSLLVATNSEYIFKPREHAIGPYLISVNVTDGTDHLRLAWKISNKDAVELSLFAGTVVDNQYVELNWETSYERDNFGFNIMRSMTRNGDYTRLNRSPIPANELMKYQFTDKNIIAGMSYYYRLEDIEYSGRRTIHEPIEVQIDRPKDFELTQNFPNPFNPVTRIQYQLPEPANVIITIYNLRGQKVRTLVNEKKFAGHHYAIWDGRDQAGQEVASGIYFYHFQSKKYRQIRRMVFLK
ncbi:T9SS type A sorting domain-containing protein [candidate division KSB1 bacterium]|nr:T9SS type A sorting domain-containing protein [candidate division KSB1 bacterium]